MTPITFSSLDEEFIRDLAAGQVTYLQSFDKGMYREDMQERLLNSTDVKHK